MKSQAAAKPGSADQAPPEEPPLDLSGQRARALVEYLLQAGARPDQVRAGSDDAQGRVVFVPAP